MIKFKIIALAFLFPLWGYSQSCNTSIVAGAAANYLFNSNLNDATIPTYNLSGTGVYSATAIEGTNSLYISETSNVVQNTSGARFLSTNNYKTLTYSLLIKANGAKSVQITNTASELTSGSDSYARFRICDSKRECNTFSGFANSGEVEDYTVTLIQGTLLPVELLSITAEPKDLDVVVEWATATELNNDKFELEYSLDGITFEKFGEVAGQRTNLETTMYAYKHKDIGRTGVEQVFYRLCQVDYDGPVWS